MKGKSDMTELNSKWLTLKMEGSKGPRKVKATSDNCVYQAEGGEQE